MVDLSSTQKSAIQHIEGPLLVIAGAGTGKTSLLVHKIAWLLREGVEPRHIAAVTSSCHAAHALRQRVAEHVSAQQALELSISNFHALGLALLRDYLAVLGYRPGFSIYDADESQALLGKLLRAARPAHYALLPTIQRQIADWKRTLTEPGPQAVLEAGPVEIAAQLYPEYERRLRLANAMDTDDLIAKPVQLLRRASTLGVQPTTLRHLLVDEYEETTPAQHELVRLLVARGAMLTAVGDDNQSISRERGASAENIQRLALDIPNLRTVRMEQNFRSSGRIVHVANALVVGQPRAASRHLWSDKALGSPLRVLKARTEDQEAERVVADLLVHKYRHGTDFRQYAVLLRSTTQAPAFERVLRERRVPFNANNEAPLLDKTEVRDLLAYLRLLCNPADDNAFSRVINTPRRDIDGVTLEALSRHAARRDLSLLEAARDPSFGSALPPERLTALRRFSDWLHTMVARAHRGDPIRLVCDVLAELRYEEWLRDTCNDVKIAERRMQHVMQLIAWLQRLARQNAGASLSDIIARLSLARLTGPNPADAPADAVALLTIEAVKGREFDHVYIVGMEQGTFPREIEEDLRERERRLAYVAMTRARHTLTFSLAERRRRSGGVQASPPSPFLTDLPIGELDWHDASRADALSPIGDAATYLANIRALSGDNGHRT